MTLVTGARLGPYTIGAAIGRGGMGEVFRAHEAPTIAYQFQGFLNSALMFTTSGIVPTTSGGFATVNSGTTLQIGELLITLSNPATPCCRNPVGLDNIVVTAAPSSAPEPTTLVQLGVGAIAAGAWRRKKRR